MRLKHAEAPNVPLHSSCKDVDDHHHHHPPHSSSCAPLLPLLLLQVSWSPGLAEVLTSAAARWAHLSASGCDAEQFVGLVRDQVHAVSTSPAYQSSMMRPDVAARLQAQMSLSVQELAAARWVFGLLDADGDGVLELSMYAGVRGIEAYVFEDKMEDADAGVWVSREGGR